MIRNPYQRASQPGLLGSSRQAAPVYGRSRPIPPSPYQIQSTQNPYQSLLQPSTPLSVSAASYLPAGTSTSTGIDMEALQQVPYDVTYNTPATATEGLLGSEPQTEVFAIYGTPITATSFDEAYEIWLNQYQPGGLEG